MADKHPGPWRVIGIVCGKTTQHNEYVITDAHGDEVLTVLHEEVAGMLAEAFNAISAERDDLEAKRKRAYEANARLESRILDLEAWLTQAESERDELKRTMDDAIGWEQETCKKRLRGMRAEIDTLRTKLKQAVGVCAEMSNYAMVHQDIIGLVDASLACDQVLSANPGLVAEIEAEAKERMGFERKTKEA